MSRTSETCMQTGQSTALRRWERVKSRQTSIDSAKVKTTCEDRPLPLATWLRSANRTASRGTTVNRTDIHWCDHALMPRIYGGADRLNAMQKVLIKFLDKISFCTYLPMYTLEERLRDMKIDSGFKSLHYAICVMCILEGDEQAEEQVRPHLPRSDVAWARSLHLLSPVPEIFVRNWLRNLLKPTRRDLSDRQKKRFADNFKRFDDAERRMMQDLISSYRAGLDWNRSDLEKLPIPLRHALYHYSVAVCKNK